MTFEDSVEKNLSLCLLEAGAPRDAANPLAFDGVSLLVGLSGGTDSTALLLVLKSISQRSKAGGRLGLELAACHVNHNLRGAEGAADEQFCRELCEQLELPLTVVDINLDQTDVKEAEAELRKARYEKLVKVAKQLDAPYIVTAHNLDDQVETLMFRLLRGTSLRGLVGMTRARQMEAALWPILLRPFLDLDRPAIEQYLVEQAKSGRYDSSNSDTKYSRNFLRSQIIAPLKVRFPRLVDNIEHFRRTVQCENDYLVEQSQALFNRAISRQDKLLQNKLLMSVLYGEHPALVGRVVTAYMEQAGIEPSFSRVSRVLDLIEQAQTASNRDFRARVSLGENLELLVSKDSILLKPLFELTASLEEYQGRLEAMLPVPVKMPRPGRSSAITVVPWLDFAVSIEEIAGSAQDLVKPRERSSFAVLVNLTGLPEAIYIRPRRPGDRLQPSGMSGLVRLKQYLHANKVLFAGARGLLPALNDILALRLIPVLALGDSPEVLWVPGFGLSEKIKGGAGASHVISLLPLSHGRHGLENGSGQRGADDAAGRFDDGTC